MVTLHAYILRELLKTFGLTLTALTVMFTMGGGLFNVVRFEGISAADVLNFIPLMIPIVVTLTMPMAALFSTTMVYGRLAADNELLACRAAGINVHRLFLSAILLSVFVAAFTLLVGSFIIPSFMQDIDSFARSNVRDLVAQQLQHKGFLHRGGPGEDRFTVTAEKVAGVTDQALRDKGFEVDRGLHYLLITNPTFLMQNANGDLERFSVARHVLCVFDTRSDPLKYTLHVRDGRNFESKRAWTIGQQQIGPAELKLPPAARLSYADLRDLLHWRRAPWEAPRLRDDMAGFIQRYRVFQFLTLAEQRLSAGAPLRLADAYNTYDVSARRAQIGGARLVLTDGRVEARSARLAAPVIYEAARIDLSAAPTPGDEWLVELRLVQTDQQDVLEINPRAGGTGVRHKPTTNLDVTVAPDEYLAAGESITPALVADPAATARFDSRFADDLASLQKGVREMYRRVVATIHFRLGYASSVLVTLLMGAALGVIFRGSRALSAFALAMVPFFSVMVLLVIAQKLTEEARWTAHGPFVTWAGLGAVLVADLLILRIGVRR